MTEWTSLSLTNQQKQRFLEAKQDAGHEGANGAFLVELIETYESGEGQEDSPKAVAKKLKDSIKPLSEERVEEIAERESEAIEEKIESMLEDSGDDAPAAISYEDVEAAAESGARRGVEATLEDLQR